MYWDSSIISYSDNTAFEQIENIHSFDTDEHQMMLGPEVIKNLTPDDLYELWDLNIEYDIYQDFIVLPNGQTRYNTAQLHEIAKTAKELAHYAEGYKSSSMRDFYMPDLEEGILYLRTSDILIRRIEKYFESESPVDFSRVYSIDAACYPYQSTITYRVQQFWEEFAHNSQLLNDEEKQTLFSLYNSSGLLIHTEHIYYRFLLYQAVYEHVKQQIIQLGDSSKKVELLKNLSACASLLFIESVRLNDILQKAAAVKHASEDFSRFHNKKYRLLVSPEKSFIVYRKRDNRVLRTSKPETYDRVLMTYHGWELKSGYELSAICF